MPLSSYSSRSCSQGVHLETVSSNCSSHHPSHLRLQASQVHPLAVSSKGCLPYCKECFKNNSNVGRPRKKSCQSSITSCCTIMAPSYQGVDFNYQLQPGCQASYRLRLALPHDHTPAMRSTEHLLDMGMSALVFSSSVCRIARIWGLSSQSICRCHHRQPPPARRLTVAFLAVRYADQATLRRWP